MISKALLWSKSIFTASSSLFRYHDFEDRSGAFLDHDLNFFAKIKLLTPYFYRDQENLKLKAPVNLSFINYVTFFNKKQPH